jgi:integrase
MKPKVTKPFEYPRDSGRFIVQLLLPQTSARAVKSKKDGSVTWKVQPKLIGKSFGRASKAENRKAADEQYVAWKADIKAGKFVAPDTTTFATVLDDLMAGKRLDRRPSTLLLYESLISRHIKPNLGHVQVQDLDYMTIRRFYQRLPPAVARQAHIIVHQALDLARRSGLVQANVSDRMFRDVPKKPADVDDPTRNAWPEDAERKVLAYVDKHGSPQDRALVRFLLATGCRIHEALGAWWKDFIEAESRFLVTRQLYPPEVRRKNPDKPFGPLKSGGQRDVPFNDDMCAALVAHRKAQKPIARRDVMRTLEHIERVVEQQNRSAIGEWAIGGNR